jgi:Protein kinase domain
VTVHDYLERKGTPFIAMEYLARGSLRPHVGRLSLAQAGGVLRAVLAGLAHAHDHGVMHRDIKPENVMVTDQGSVKIADFGIAKAVDATRTSATLTVAGTTLGTPRYMSPERAMGQALGPWSDLYSVGAMAFEMLSGQPPFADTVEPMAILMRQINEPIPAVGTVVPALGDVLDDWIGQLLEKDPHERTQSAAAAADALDDILMGRLGPRWQRDAQLPATPAARGATARPRAAAPAPAAPRATLSRALTVAPSTVPLRRRRRGALVLPLAAVAVAAIGFGARGLHAASPPGGTSTPADLGTHDAASAPRDATAGASREQDAVRLAADYTRAARRARAADNLDRAATLSETAKAYRDAADAARRGDGSDYDDAVADAAALRPRAQPTPAAASGVGDSRSDDPSDDEPDENDNGD